MISTRDLSALPDIAGFRRLTRSLAVLDAILSPDWEYRYYSFNAEWGPGEMMASMRNGSGDHWFALLCDAGVALHGLAHESPLFRQGNPPAWLFAQLPAAFTENFLRENAFETQHSTFCIWRRAGDAAWQCGRPASGDGAEGDDGSTEMLSILDGDPARYVAFATDYYEREVDAGAVKAIYDHAPMTEALAQQLDEDVDYEALADDLREIGYPEGG